MSWEGWRKSPALVWPQTQYPNEFVGFGPSSLQGSAKRARDRPNYPFFGRVAASRIRRKRVSFPTRSVMKTLPAPHVLMRQWLHDPQAITVAGFAISAQFLGTAGWFIQRNLRHNEPGLRLPLALPFALAISASGGSGANPQIRCTRSPRRTTCSARPARWGRSKSKPCRAVSAARTRSGPVPPPTGRDCARTARAPRATAAESRADGDSP